MWRKRVHSSRHPMYICSLRPRMVRHSSQHQCAKGKGMGTCTPICMHGTYTCIASPVFVAMRCATYVRLHKLRIGIDVVFVARARAQASYGFREPALGAYSGVALIRRASSPCSAPHECLPPELVGGLLMNVLDHCRGCWTRTHRCHICEPTINHI